jgi:hypothetical protein
LNFKEISSNTTSDNLNSQETTNQDTYEMGADGADLSCPGTSLVAKRDNEKDMDETRGAQVGCANNKSRID